MGTPTNNQREASRKRAYGRRVLVGKPGDRLRWIAMHLPPERHGTRTARGYYGCECEPCLAADNDRPPHNSPERRKRARQAALARRELIDGRLVATHLAPEKHGTKHASEYYGCNCPICTEGVRMRRLRKKSGKS